MGEILGRAGQGGGDGVVGAGVEDVATDAPLTPKAAQTASTTSGVEVSSRLKPDVVDVDGPQVQLEVAGGVRGPGWPGRAPAR